MKNNYRIDLSQIRLEQFKKMLLGKELLPSRQSLKEEIQERFETLASMGIGNLDDLEKALKTKQKVSEFAQKSGIPNDYLTLLRREVNSYIPKPVRLSEFPEVNPMLVDLLGQAGITHTGHLLEKTADRAERLELAVELGIPQKDLLELLELADLTRIVGVGPVFARLLHEAGIQSAAEFGKYTAEELTARVEEELQRGAYPQISIRVEDFEYCLETAQLLPDVIEY